MVNSIPMSVMQDRRISAMYQTVPAYPLAIHSLESNIYGNKKSISSTNKDQVYAIRSGNWRMLGSRRKLVRTVYNKYISLLNITRKISNLEVKTRERHFCQDEEDNYYEIGI